MAEKRYVGVGISLPKKDLAAIDELAAETDRTRSEVMQEAAADLLKKVRRKKAKGETK